MKHRHLAVAVVLLSFMSDACAQFAPADVLTSAWSGSPIAVRTADIDGDGDLDMATASTLDGKMRWIENDGTGFFKAPHALGTDLAGVTDLRLGDLDGDGDADVVACSDLTDHVQWSANDGTGVFGAPVIMASALLGVSSLELVDLDTDGDLDVVASAFDLDSVVWIANAGSGSFLAPQGLCGEVDGVRDIAVADLDADGDLDLVTTAFLENDVSWFANDGAQQFGAEQSLLSGLSGPAFCEVGDLDGDTDPDVVFGYRTSGGLRWTANNGSGSFSGGGNVININFIRSLQLSDTDGDGDLDVVYAGNLFLAGTELARAESLGGGSFVAIPQSIFTTTSSSVRAEMGDIDGDGISDLVFASEQEQEAGWIPNPGDGTFGAPWMASPPCEKPEDLASADLDGDGDDDLIVGSRWDGKVTWLRNDAGAFVLAQNISHTLGQTEGVCAGDLDSDGDVDILTVSKSDTVCWFANDGLGHFGPKQIIDVVTGYNYSAALGDMDADGDLDVLTTRTNGSQLLLYRNAGNGTFAAFEIINSTTTNIQDIRIGDLDGDLDPDIALAALGDSRIAWLPNNGAGIFGAQQNVTSSVNGASRLRLGDLDGNGSLDIACTGEYSDPLYWFANNGTGTFLPQPDITSTSMGAIDIADLDADGDNDVVGMPSAGNNVYWFTNDGTGAFGAAILMDGTAPTGEGVLAADLDGDGDNDVVTATQGDHQVRLYENHATSPYRIQGRLFHDANSSGDYDTGEGTFPFIGVASAPYFAMPYTTDDGQYTFYLGQGNYTIASQAPDALWALTTPFPSYDITLTTGSPVSTGNDFGYVPVGTVNDIIASLSPLWGGCSGQINEWITVRNTGNTEPNVVLAFDPDPLYTFVSSTPASDSIVGGTYYWSYAALGYYAENKIRIRLLNPDATHVGEAVTNALTANIMEAGSVLATFTDTAARTVACSYDPNDKLVDPIGYGDEGVVDVDLPFFEYTVRFQNTGNATANTVTVRDELDPSLDRSTVQLVGSSHTITDMRIEVDGELVFTFDDIQLPDSGANGPDSHGFITFRASPLEGTPSGTTIGNTADIYFDYNAPVITNTVSNLLIDCDLFSATITPLTNDLLQASEGESYLWYKDGNLIPGETSQELLVEVTGFYSVEVRNQYGCTLLSEELQVVIEGLQDAGTFHMAVVPNPMSDVARIILGSALSSDERIELVDASGRVLRTFFGNGTREVLIERGHLESGMYVLRVMRDGGHIGSVRIVIH